MWTIRHACKCQQFGDKVTAEITGDPNAPLLTRIEIVAVPATRHMKNAEVVTPGIEGTADE